MMENHFTKTIKKVIMDCYKNIENKILIINRIMRSFYILYYNLEYEKFAKVNLYKPYFCVKKKNFHESHIILYHFYPISHFFYVYSPI